MKTFLSIIPSFSGVELVEFEKKHKKLPIPLLAKQYKLFEYLTKAKQE